MESLVTKMKNIDERMNRILNYERMLMRTSPNEEEKITGLYKSTSRSNFRILPKSMSTDVSSEFTFVQPFKNESSFGSDIQNEMPFLTSRRSQNEGIKRNDGINAKSESFNEEANRSGSSLSTRKSTSMLAKIHSKDPSPFKKLEMRRQKTLYPSESITDTKNPNNNTKRDGFDL